MKLKTTTGPDLEPQALDPAALPEALDSARRNLEHARRILADQAHPDAEGILGRELVNLGRLLALDRQLEQAQQTLGEAMEVWARLGRARPLWLTGVRQAAIWRQQGQAQQALEALDQLCARCQEPELAMYHDFGLYERALAAWRAGALEQAAQDLRQALQIRQARPKQALVDELHHAAAVMGLVL